MARPTKLSVDYFPHFVGQGKTIRILQGKYGIKGYAFLFKLLEAISASDTMCLDWNRMIDREFFAADTETDIPEAENILELLAQIGLIDTDLWHEKHLIWCQNLVDNLSEVWKKRKQKKPQKPNSGKPGFFREFQEKPPVSEGFRPGNPRILGKTPLPQGVSDPETPQSKVKESKVEERKLVKESAEIRAGQPTDPLPHSMPKKTDADVKTGKPGTAEKNAEQKTPLQEIQKLLLAYAEAKGIKLATQKERRTYLNSSPFFYEAKNVIEATGSLEKAKAYIFAQAEHYKAENKSNWGLDWALQDFWKAKEQGTDTEQVTDRPKEPDSYRRCECGQLLGGASIRIDTGQGAVDAAMIARCPMCGKIYGMQTLEGFEELGITQARLAEILKQSHLESFSQSEWAEWLELVP